MHDGVNSIIKIVYELSESFGEADNKSPWRERKLIYLEHLKNASYEAQLVALADKLHNIKSTLKDFHEQGDSVWDRFSAGYKEQLW